MDTPPDQETWHQDDGTGPLDVVMGVDGSLIALQAVRWAVAEARLRGLALRILHAAPYAVDSPPRRNHARDILARAFVVAHQTDAGVPVTTHLVERDAVSSLLDAAHRAQLLVVGLGGGLRPEEALISSVTLDISRHCPSPLAVVRGGHHPPTDRPVRVGVYDPAEDADALTVAFADAHRHGGRVVVLHAGPGDRFRNDPEALAPWTTRFPDVPVELRIVPGQPVTTLLSAAPEARLVVLGTRPRGAVARAVFGSTSRPVLRRSPVPVVVVNPRALRPTDAKIAEPVPLR